MNISTSIIFRAAVVSAWVSACAILSACGQATVAPDASAAMPTSATAAMGPVFFGDTMSFGADDSADRTTLVADYKAKARGF